MSLALSTDRSATVRTLQERIRSLEAPQLDHTAVPTDPAFLPLLGDRPLQRGYAYRVSGSLQLAFTLTSRASEQGLWCAFLGFPSLGIEALYDAGLELSKVVWIPAPGPHSLTVLNILTEACDIVLTDALSATPHQCGQIAARLRQHRSMLITLGDWHNAEAALRVESSHWHGIEQGFGFLQTRELAVRAHTRVGPRRSTLRLCGKTVTPCDAHPKPLRAVVR